METLLEKRSRLSPEELQAFINTRGWQVIVEELRGRLQEAERKLKHISQHPANFPSTNEYAVQMAAQGAICRAFEVLIKLPADLLERPPQADRPTRE